MAYFLIDDLLTKIPIEFVNKWQVKMAKKFPSWKRKTKIKKIFLVQINESTRRNEKIAQYSALVLNMQYKLTININGQPHQLLVVMHATLPN